MSGRILVRFVSGPDAGMARRVDARLSVGRGGDADLRLTDPSVSRRHALVEPRPEGLLVVDTGASAGTRVAGRRVVTPTLAKPGVSIRFGDSTALVLHLRAAPGGNGVPSLSAVHEGAQLASVPVRGEILLGRDRAGDLCIDHSSVSRRHATVRETQDGPVLTDLGSANGTRVNGQRVRGDRLLQPGDTVVLGSSRVSITLTAAHASAGAARDLQVTSETGLAVHAVSVQAPDDATVGDVVGALAAYLGLPDVAGTTWGAYVAASGSLLRSADRWADLPVQRGDLLTLAAFGDPGLLEGDLDDARWEGPADPTVNTPPRSTSLPALVEVATPALPEGTELKGRGVVWQIAAGGVAVLAAVVVALRFPTATLFAMVAAVAGLATIGFGILGEQARRRHGVRTFESELSRLDTRLAELSTQQGAMWRDLNPDRAALTEWVHSQGPRLWERRVGDADVLRLRLGVGARQLSVKFTGTSAGESHGPYAARLAEVRDRHRTVAAVPVTTPPGGVVVGLAGSRPLVTGVAAHAVLEAAVLHAPSALHVVVVSLSDDWRWVRWLPHVRPAAIRLLEGSAVDSAALESALRTATGDVAAGGQKASVLLVVGQGGSGQPAVIDAMEIVQKHGGLVLVLDDDVRSLPPECQIVCHVDASGQATAEGSWVDGPVGAFAVTTVDPESATGVAIELGRLRDPRLGGAGSSRSPGVMELSGVPAAHGLEQQWATPGPLLSTFASDDQGQPVSVDLRRDGPHGVIAGTTGSGKSELLLSVIGSLVARHPPERLVLFLIDFKGGATFAPLKALPHVVGYVTDLDGSGRLAERAFTALDAEISRRKRLLADHGVPDLMAYERLVGVDPLPSLVVVIDEFALLVTEQPSVKVRLDAVAAQGRSLGIHLLLATQSPGGVITPAIRANTNIWLCLRVANDTESMEILGARSAAQIATDQPGRAYLRRGAEHSLIAFQTARITSPSQSGGEVEVRVMGFGEPPPTAVFTATQRTDPTATELDDLVAEAHTVHGRTGRVPFALWMPPLPSELDDSHPALMADDPVRGDGLPLTLGLLDEPELQRQRAWQVDLALTNLLVSGVFRSGRTTTVRRALSELARFDPQLVHLYVVDARGGLRDVEDLPQTGGYAGVHDRELLVAVIDRVVRTVEARRERGFDSSVDPRVVLVVDDYPAFRETSQTILQDRLNDQLLSLVSQGRGVGVHVVMTCGQVSDLRLTMASHFQSKLLLRQPEAADYVAVDVRLSPSEMPPDLAGRGIVRGGHEVQVVHHAVPLSDSRRPSAGPVGAPVPVRRLPMQHTGRAGGDRGSWPVGHIPIGVGGDDASPIWLGPRHGPHLVVLGEALTGRSTTLHTVASQLLAENPTRVLAVVSRRPGPVLSLADESRLLATAAGPEQLDALLAAVESSTAPVVLVIDDAEGMGAAPSAGDRLDRLLRDARSTGLRAVVASRTADWARMFDGWARYLASLRVALLLAPTPESALALEVRLPAAMVPMVQGRGFLVAGGVAELVQVSRLVEADVVAAAEAGPGSTPVDVAIQDPAAPAS